MARVPDRPIGMLGRFGPAGERDVVLYDGLGIETGADRPVGAGTCVGCGAPCTVDLRPLVLGPAWSDPPPEEITAGALAAVVEEFRLDPTRFDGSTYLTDRNRLSVFATVHRCAACSVQMLQLVSYGEYQPARWMAFMVGAAEILER